MPLITEQYLSEGPDKLLKTAQHFLKTGDAKSFNEIAYTIQDIHDVFHKFVADEKEFHQQISTCDANLIQPDIAKKYRENIFTQFKLNQDRINLGLVLILLRNHLEFSDIRCIAYFLELGANENILQIFNVSLEIKNQILNEAFLKRFPQAVQKLYAVDASVQTVNDLYCNHPLIHVLICDLRDFEWIKIAVREDTDFEAKRFGLHVTHRMCTEFQNPTLEVAKRWIRFVANPASEIPFSKLKGMTLNSFDKDWRTPLKCAVIHNSLIWTQALIECAEEMNLSLFPDNNRSIWELTTHSGYQHTPSEKIALAIIQHALRVNAKLPANQQVDVMGLKPIWMFFATHVPYDFVHTALHLKWDQVVKLALRHHPEWLNQQIDSSLIHKTMDRFDREYHAEDKVPLIFWHLIKLGANLETRFQGLTVLERMGKFNWKKVTLLPELDDPCVELVTNTVRMGADCKDNPDAAAQAETTRLNELLKAYGKQNFFFQTMREKTENIRFNFYMTCYRMCQTGLAKDIVLLVLSFNDLSAFMLSEKEQKAQEAKDTLAPDRVFSKENYANANRAMRYFVNRFFPQIKAWGTKRVSQKPRVIVDRVGQRV